MTQPLASALSTRARGHSDARELAPPGLSLILGGAAVAVYVTSLRGLAPLPAPHHLPWPVLAAAFALAELMIVRFDLSRHTQVLSLSEVVLVLGLVFATPGQLLLARLVGEALALAAMRQAPSKLAFNVGRHLLETCIAVLVYRAVLDNHSPISAIGWVAALVTVCAVFVTSGITLFASRSLSVGRVRLEHLGPVMLDSALSAVIGTVVAVVVVMATWLNPWALWLAALLTLLVYVGSNRYASLRRRYANLSGLYEFTRALSGTTDVATKVEPLTVVVLRKATQLLHAGRGELVIVTPTGRARRSVLGPGGELESSPVLLDPAGAERRVLDTGSSLILRRASRTAANAWTSRNVADAMVAPLPGGDGFTGTLLVADRQADVRTFDREDLRLFEALANHAGVALHNERLGEQLRQESAEREHRARHDALTGLPNRTLFTDMVDRAISSAGSSSVAVLLIDLDRFKEVNDTLGHENGDLLLREAAARLRHRLAGRGTVARLGGDEFGVVLPDPGGPGGAEEVAAQLKEVLTAPFAVEELTFEVTASIGIALHPLHGNEATTLLQRADVAMYAAKDAHGDTRVYAPEQDHHTARRLALVGELRQAIEDGELTVHYQPVASLAAGEVVSVEALVRWPHREHGFLPPDEFIPIAEHTGLIRPLTDLVLRSALGECAEWRRRGLALDVSVNLSVRNLLEADLVDKVTAMLGETGVPATSLSLEITESEIMSDLERTIGALSRLSAMGISLAVDDFGTGYSSLSYLQRLPVDEVKIDKSFVLDMATDSNAGVIVRSTVSLARSLGLRVLAEGVEDRPTWERLRGLGCDLAQGYVVSKPLPPGRLESWLEGWPPGVRRTAAGVRRHVATGGLRVVADDGRPS